MLEQPAELAGPALVCAAHEIRAARLEVRQKGVAFAFGDLSHGAQHDAPATAATNGVLHLSPHGGWWGRRWQGAELGLCPAPRLVLLGVGFSAIQP